MENMFKYIGYCCWDIVAAPVNIVLHFVCYFVGDREINPFRSLYEMMNDPNTIVEKVWAIVAECLVIIVLFFVWVFMRLYKFITNSWGGFVVT